MCLIIQQPNYLNTRPPQPLRMVQLKWLVCYFIIVIAIPISSGCTIYEDYDIFQDNATLSMKKQPNTARVINIPKQVKNATLPVVLIHGILSSAAKIQHVADWITNKTGARVYNIEIGEGASTSTAMYMALQRDLLCLAIYNISVLRGGFNIIGISQGGLLARGYVEHCNGYKVNNLITWVSPHGGIFIPELPMPTVYTPDVQYSSSVSNYWRDPFRYTTYLKNSSYLAKLNNENQSPSRKADADKYKANMMKLSNFVMIWSSRDDVLRPPESGKFSMYEPVFLPDNHPGKMDILKSQYMGPAFTLLKLQRLQETYMYKADAIGLKTLDRTSRLHMYETDCNHADHVTPECLEAWAHYTLPYLV